MAQRGVKFFYNSPLIKKLIKMLAYVEIITLYLKKFNIFYEGKERPAQTKLMALRQTS